VNAKARKPVVRQLSIGEWPDGRWSNELPSETDQWAGGDCGGGVFDATGRLVAILLPGSENPDGHKRIELLRTQWNDLHAPFEMATTSEIAAVESELRPAAQQVQACTVEILDGDTPVSLGTIVGAEGKLLTKASVVPEHPHCRLPDGRVLPAKVLKTIRQFDVAILKVDANNLPVVQWSSNDDLPVGTIVGLASKNSRLGFIAHSALSFPAERGWLGGDIRDTEQGPQVEQLFDLDAGKLFADFTPRPLRKGDVILSVDGHPTRTRQELLGLFDDKQATPLALAGDRVHLVVRRKAEQIEFDSVLDPPTWPRMAGQSARCSGFAGVYGVAASPDFNLCGGPVHDRDGRAIGIVIAGRQKGWLLVLPAATAKELAAD
jgi:serine protease Do